MVTLTEVREAVEAVPDPEMPPVTIGDLGMVEDVRVAADGTVEVELIPTFSGCPAIRVIEEDVTAALDGSPVSVRWRRDLVWDPQRISAEGRAKLRAFGIAPPPGERISGGPGRARPTLVPLLSRSASEADRPSWGGQSASEADRDRGCPYCGSADTVTDSPFGPTPCRSTHYCRSCRNPFEAIKP